MKKQVFSVAAAAAALVVPPAYAQVGQTSDEYKQVEYKVRRELGSGNSSHFLLQDKVPDSDSEEQCGWIWSTKPYPNDGWKLFRYVKIGDYESVELYEEDRSYKTNNYFIMISCYDKGYIPSLLPLGRYAKQWDAMKKIGRLDNYGL